MRIARLSLFLGILWMLAPVQASAQIIPLPDFCSVQQGGCDGKFRRLAFNANLGLLKLQVPSGFVVTDYDLSVVNNCFVYGIVHAVRSSPPAARTIQAVVAANNMYAFIATTAILPSQALPPDVNQYDFCIPQGESPILLDLGRPGFELTSAQDGVRFDIDADGTPDQVAWTSRRSLDPFLALDRNGNGRIDDGAELFGNATRLADGTLASDGYAALAELDLPVHGGNGNGYIDRDDRAYGDLVLWTDSNHNGVSDRGELVPLARRGVLTILTDASSSPEVDEHGNAFALVSWAYVKAGRGVRPILTTDVFLVTEEASR